MVRSIGQSLVKPDVSRLRKNEINQANSSREKKRERIQISVCFWGERGQTFILSAMANEETGLS